MSKKDSKSKKKMKRKTDVILCSIYKDVNLYLQLSTLLQTELRLLLNQWLQTLRYIGEKRNEYSDDRQTDKPILDDPLSAFSFSLRARAFTLDAAT